jgi:putative aldouronate transport system substrate-binding protein
MKKLFSLSMAVLFALALALMGCQAKQPAASTTVSASTFSKTPGQESEYWGTYNPPISITANIMTQTGWRSEFPTGQTWADNNYVSYVAKKYGIQFVNTWVAQNDELNNSRMNLALVNNSLPDLINTRGNQLGAMVAAGKLLPLDDLIEQYGSPLLKYIIEESNRLAGGNLKSPFTIDGKLYMMPWFSAIWEQVWYHNWIRTDYLDELNLGMPNTLAEFETVMAAYKARHPNGVALVLAAGNQESITGMEPVMEAYGAFPGLWLKDGSGGLKFGTIQPEVKQGLAKLAEWYKNGWVDQEFVVKDNGIAETRISSGDTIMWHAAWWAVWHTIPTAEQNDPRATYRALPAFLRADGTRLQAFDDFYSAASDGFAISAACKNPEAIIRFANLCQEYALMYDADMRNLMKETYNYTMFEPTTDKQFAPFTYNTSAAYFIPEGSGSDDPEAENNLTDEERKQGSLEPLNKNTLTTLYGFMVGGNPETQGLLPQYMRLDEYASGRAPYESLTDADLEQYYSVRGATVIMDAAGNRQVTGETYPKAFDALMSGVRLYNTTFDNEEYFYDTFNGAPTPAMLENNAYLSKLTMETFSRIIMGQASVDSFDAFVQDWLSAGGQKIVDEVNEWYKATK